MGVLLVLGGVVGGVAGSGKTDNLLKSDILGDIVSVTQFFDPIFSGAIASAQEGYRQEKQMKDQARAIEGQARIDAEQARRQSLFLTGQEYLYFVRGGVQTGVGAPLDLLTQNALEREKEALAIELKGWNEGKQLRIGGINAKRAAVTGAIHAMTDPLKEVLANFGMGQSQLRPGGGSGSAGVGAAGGVSYAGASAAGIDAAAGGAAAVNGAGTGLGALALV